MFIQVILLACILAFVDANLPTNLDASSLPSTRGVLIEGPATSVPQNAGSSVRNLGDINKDGIDDYAVGAKYGSFGSRQYCGVTYVMYGSHSMSGTVDLGTVASSAGYQIIGEASNDFSGSVIGSADVNGDGFKDVLVGVQLASPTVGGVQRARAGTMYVIYGKASRTTNVDLASLSPADGFKVFGAVASDFSGNCISSAGDINKDGFEDFIIGASQANRLGRSLSGVAYVLFGKPNFGASIDLGALTPADGFQIIGAIANGYVGNAVNYAGDFNKDGVDDFIIGSYLDGPTKQGVAYVFYGKSSGSFSNVDLASFTSSSSVGVRILGESWGDQLGFSVASAGDFNGDGINDLVIGANFVDPDPHISNAGAAYVIYGKVGSGADIQVSRTMPSFGVAIYGASTNYNLGYSVSGGDFDQDGFSDVLLGANQQAVNGVLNVGVAYVIAGKPASAVSSLFTSSWDASWGYFINGIASGDNLGSSVDLSGDFNGDGMKDALIGAPMASPNGRTNAGSVYALMGSGSSKKPTVSPSAAPTVTPSEVPSRSPSTTVPSMGPTTVPSVTPSVSPSVTLSAVPSVSPTAVPTLAPTAVPSNAPTRTPNSDPTMSPTNRPTQVPTAGPTTAVPVASPTRSESPSAVLTMAPTHSERQIQYTLTMDLTGVLTAELTTEGRRAMENTIAELTGLPTSNVILIRTVSSTPVENALRKRLRSEATTYILKEEVLSSVDMGKDYDPGTQLELQCNNYQQKLGTFVTDGSFQVTLRAQAALLSASELSNVIIPHDLVIIYSTCKNIPDDSNAVVNSNSSATSKLAVEYVAMICSLTLFFVALCLCTLYICVYVYREKQDDKIADNEKVEMEDSFFNESSFTGIYDCHDEVDSTVLVFLSSSEDEIAADAFGFVPRRSEPVEGPNGNTNRNFTKNVMDLDDFMNSFSREETVSGGSSGSDSRSNSPPTLYTNVHIDAVNIMIQEQEQNEV
jgi:hypothetical protein